MAHSVQYTATPRRPQWQDLSDEHTRLRASLDTALRTFGSGKGARVQSIVGAYGSGKSELMAWGFHHCWTALGIPALVLNAEQLLGHLPQQMGPGDLADAVGKFVHGQLAKLLESLEVQPVPDDILLATDIRIDESTADYLFDLFGEQNTSLAELRTLLETQRAVIFLDEIEQKYGELLERVESSDRAPLRELLQRVEHGQTPYYLVLSFGLTSAYEAIGGADARRMDTLTLPIPEPRALGRLAGLAGYENFIWWTSRGRPGWAVKLANDWAGSLDRIVGLEQFNQLQPNTIENLPLVNANGFPEALGSSRVNELATQLLKRLEPVPRSSLTLAQPGAQEPANLPRYQVLLANQAADLVAVDVLVDAFVQDLAEQATKLTIPVVDVARLRLYLTTVIASLATEDRRVVFGGPRKVEWLAKAAIAPILTLVVDLLLEFEGDHQDALSVLNLLDKVMGQTGIIGEEVQDSYKLVDNFRRVEELFIETRSFPETAWISLSPRAIEAIFPRIVGRPLLTLSLKAKRTLDEQRAAVEAAVAAGAPILTSRHHRDKTEVVFLFAPDEQCWAKVRTAMFAKDRRRTYLEETRVYAVVPLNNNETLEIATAGTHDDAAILRDLSKLQCSDLSEKRLKDFVISLWHHALVQNRGNGAHLDLWEVLQTALQSEGLSKSNRRKLEYYRQRLRQRLDDLVLAAVPQYRRNLRRLFDVDDDRFPDRRLEETRTKVRENRTIEQVALAFDLVEHAPVTVAALSDLRELRILRKETSQPHAYDEFLETYTVVMRPAPGPGASLKELVDYVAQHDGCDDLRGLAGRLALAPPLDFADAQQATENAPLLILFHGIAPAQSYFLRGLSLHRYLENNRDHYAVLAADIQADLKPLIARLDALANKVDELNRALDYALLSAASVVGYAAELRKLEELLTKASDLPAATLYMVCRFAESAVAKVEELQQRWASEHGLEGWRTQLGSLLSWRRKLAGISEELDRIYTDNKVIKEDILGPRKNIEQALHQQLQQNARAVLESVNEQSDLLMGARRLSIADYDKTSTIVREQLDRLDDQATAIDTLITRLTNLADQTKELIDRCADEENLNAL